MNLTPIPRPGWRVGVPRRGQHAVLLDTDAAAYGGSGFRAGPDPATESTPWHGRPQSLVLDLPPLAVLVLEVLP
jgi:1,4-alpha-glucan branching enzyme